MRINLDCPFKEKDDAKALGAQWDMARKCWYIVDMEDLTPFMRWIRSGFQPKGKTPAGAKEKHRLQMKAHVAKERAAVKTTYSQRHDLECGCSVAPWDHCEHSMEREDSEAHAAMQEMLCA